MSPRAERFEVIVVGAGFGGLAMAHQLAEAGIADFVILERDDGVGGTWRQNTYPGAACDVPSHLYSLSYALNPHWSRAFAGQPEILRYVEACYDRLDIRRKVRCSTEIVAATWLADEHRWRLRDQKGTTYEARVFVAAIGTFHTPVVPSLPGLGDFGGSVFHSARWDHSVDLSGRRVGVIGTGASAIQVVPAIADIAAQVDVYQRTPAWILPRRDTPYPEEQRNRFETQPDLARQHRNELHDLLEATTTFLTGDPSSIAIARLALEHLEAQVLDVELRARLTPSYPIGCKRILVSSDFYPALERPDVELVTDRIDRLTTRGIRPFDGAERAYDAIVMCTGFDAPNYLRGIQVVGDNQLDLHEHWAGTPRAYLGMAVPAFPNLFIMYGPNTNQGGNSILLILEAQARFIASAVCALRDARATRVEVRLEAMGRYLEELEAAMAKTVWQHCDSYFRTAAGDVVTQLPHTSGWYREQTAEFAADDFVVDGQAFVPT